MKNKNVMFICSRYPSVGGGIEKVTTYLSSSLVEDGYSVCIVGFDKEKSSSGYLLPDNQVEVMNTPNGLDDICSEDNIKFINSVIDSHNIGTIIFQDSYSPVYQILYHIDKAPKIIVVEHNIPTALIDDKVAEFKETRITNAHSLIRKLLFPVIYLKNVYQVKRHHKIMYSLADEYIVLAKAYENTVRRLAGTKDTAGKIHTINNPLTIERPQNLDLSSKNKEILFVGRLTGQKGVDYLLDIWKLFANEENSWILKIVGDGPMKQDMEERILKENIPNVILEGNQKDVEKFYKQSSVVLFTSRFEGWGLVLTEGMAFGNIVMAFDSYGAVHDIIHDGQDGFIIKAFDCKACAKKLILLTQNSALRKKMAENAFKSADRFKMENILSKWETIIY